MGLVFKDTPRSNLTITYPKGKKKIKSTNEAMAILSHVHWKEVKRGRIVARMIALEKGTCTAREMVEYMIAEGSLVAGSDPEYWVSAVFRSDEWEWTGQWVYNSKSLNTQGGLRGIKGLEIEKTMALKFPTATHLVQAVLTDRERAALDELRRMLGFASDEAAILGAMYALTVHVEPNADPRLFRLDRRGLHRVPEPPEEDSLEDILALVKEL